MSKSNNQSNLNNHANQRNPNSSAYKAGMNNRSNQMNPNNSSSKGNKLYILNIYFHILDIFIYYFFFLLLIIIFYLLYIKYF